MKLIKVYTWAFCPYCIQAKMLLDREGIAYEEYCIDGQRDVLMSLKAKTGSGTVPQIFVDDAFIGGCDDLQALRRDETRFKTVFGLSS
ncbi:glutathione S-transferase N-terminal domain-containing protein [Fusibacter paucivorans]|uniref:Glutathione S-transferase N-terminal domain-containing protein n=1 Tax=Fusibacter paucivorans TaxID=76009 RepID=A0ABS5PQL2_9FIRM|nr:glutaredoxin domain-containing protein [Fusibacter paucivorans]MBS7527217.1 glutathione S-transferase N-terminal domain-containing protein [Fusibacter paucivorans]